MDSNDRERINEAREELKKMLEEDELRDAVLLVFANKQDLPNAYSVAEVSQQLGLHNLKARKWHVQGTCATRVSPPERIELRVFDCYTSSAQC